MTRKPQGGSRTVRSGFTLFELTVFIILLAILAGVFFDRMLFYQEVSEKIMMRQTVAMVESAMNMQLASWMAEGETGKIPLFAKRNPMTWLDVKPPNYFGEIYDPAPGDIPSGNWYFDLKDGCLVYLVKRSAHFSSGGRDSIRFRVDPGYNGLKYGGRKIRLAPVHAYTWLSP